MSYRASDFTKLGWRNVNFFILRAVSYSNTAWHRAWPAPPSGTCWVDTSRPSSGPSRRTVTRRRRRTQKVRRSAKTRSRTGWCCPAAAQLRSRPRWNSRRSTARGALSRHKFVIASAASSRKLPNTPRDHPQTHDTLSERLAQTNVFQPSRRESLLLVERPLDPVRSCLF